MPSHRVVDLFTTENGEWFVNPERRWGITPAMLEKYGDVDIPGKGGDHHIFCFSALGQTVTIHNRYDSSQDVNIPIPASGWVEYPLYGGSSYNPDRGELGPYDVWVDGSVVAQGIGMPNRHHVSTFVVTDRIDGEVPEVPPPSVGGVRHTLYADGRLVYDSGGMGTPPASIHFSGPT